MWEVEEVSSERLADVYGLMLLELIKKKRLTVACVNRILHVQMNYNSSE
jgi:hypothetical protein